MRIGILADVHEQVAHLRTALALFRREGVEQVLFLGDVYDMGDRLAESVALLAAAGAVGVWGNHELGLCYEPTEHVRRAYAGPVLEFMAALRPRLEWEGYLFTHGLPCWDPTDPAVYYLGERPETAQGQARTFASCGHPAVFVGHFHRWLAATPQGLLAWDGRDPLLLHPDRRHLVVVAAVCDGWCAVFDTGSRRLLPCPLWGAGQEGPGGK